MNENSKKIIVFGSLAESLVNFRGPLLYEMVDRGHRVIACAPEAPSSVINALASIGVEYKNIPLDRAGLNPVRDIRTFYALVTLFKKVKPDIVLSYTIKPVLYGSLAAYLTGITSIFSMITGLGYAFSSGDFRQKLTSMIARFLYKLSLWNNRKVFFQNPDDKMIFERLNLLKKSDQAVLINGSGIDIEKFQSAPFPSNVSFLLIARLIKDKGILEYIEAARIIKAKNHNVTFRLVGWIDENPSAIKDRDLHGWVEEGIIEYLGRLEDVRPSIAESSVYVLPSYREGTPRTVLEAMAMGRPIITTDSPGCRETVQEGRNGFLVPIKDAMALAEAMQKFIDNPSLIRQMGAESRKIAVGKYDVHKVNAVILQTLGLLDEKSV